MTSTTLHRDDRPTGLAALAGRAWKPALIAALWAAAVLNLAGVLPVSTPPRYDWLLAVAVGVATVAALYGAAMFGAMRAGRWIERECQRLRRPTAGRRG